MGVSRHEVSLFNLRHRVFSGGLYVEADYTFPAHCFVCVCVFIFLCSNPWLCTEQYLRPHSFANGPDLEFLVICYSKAIGRHYGCQLLWVSNRAASLCIKGFFFSSFFWLHQHLQRKLCVLLNLITCLRLCLFCWKCTICIAMLLVFLPCLASSGRSRKCTEYISG